MPPYSVDTSFTLKLMLNRNRLHSFDLTVETSGSDKVPALMPDLPFSDVHSYRLELEGITVKGKGCPKPIKTWVQCGTSMKILNALKRSV